MIRAVIVMWHPRTFPYRVFAIAECASSEAAGWARKLALFEKALA
jgi:hypothetical protein